MDEVDGMGGSDRGGIPELIKVSYLIFTLSYLPSVALYLSLSPSLYHTQIHTYSPSLLSLTLKPHAHYLLLFHTHFLSLHRSWHTSIIVLIHRMGPGSWISAPSFPGYKGIKEPDYLHMQRQTSTENKVLDSSLAVLTYEVHTDVISYYIMFVQPLSDHHTRFWCSLETPLFLQLSLFNNEHLSLIIHHLKISGEPLLRS